MAISHTGFFVLSWPPHLSVVRRPPIPIQLHFSPLEACFLPLFRREHVIRLGNSMLISALTLCRCEAPRFLVSLSAIHHAFELFVFFSLACDISVLL